MNDLLEDPIRQFQSWYKEAVDTGMYLPEAMTLATTSSDGKPSARVMLLKDVSDRGFSFFTNYESRKGLELATILGPQWFSFGKNWDDRFGVEGRAEPLQKEASEAYFRSRPHGSQIGAWASPQSRPIANRRELDTRVKEAEARFAEEEVPLPPHWGGYKVRPEVIEFWEDRPSRLHDRIRFCRTDHGWAKERLAP